MDKSPAQIAASEKAKANAIISGKRLDQFESDLALLRAGTLSLQEANRQWHNHTHERLNRQQLLLDAISVDVQLIDNNLDSLRRWTMIRDVIGLLLMILLLLLVGYNTTQFWGW